MCKQIICARGFVCREDTLGLDLLQARDSSQRGFLESHVVRAPTKVGYRQMLTRMAVHLFLLNIMLQDVTPELTNYFKEGLDEAMSDYFDFL